MLLTVLSLLSLAVWLYLTLGHGRFWHADQRLDPSADDPVPAPGLVVAVVPARNEADVVGPAITSLLAQDLPGGLNVVLVDDGSTDGTGGVARGAAEALGRENALTVLRGAARPAGWAGKVWAMHQGAREAARLYPDARYLLLTDADIRHAPGNLRALLGAADRGTLVLTSQMVRLHCRGFWERQLIPAFVYFFQMLYPFPWVNRPSHRMAAAAGGCMLVERRALAAAGGLEAIRDRIIDDCALGAALKRQGPIRLCLTADTHSLRPYDGLNGIWSMVARTAFVQLRHSVAILLFTVLGMILTYLAAPIALLGGLLIGNGVAVIAGLATLGLMVLTYAPTLRFYGLGAWRGSTLPLVGILYTLMTLDSARRHWLGRGGQWKGRVAGGIAGETPEAGR